MVLKLTRRYCAKSIVIGVVLVGALGLMALLWCRIEVVNEERPDRIVQQHNCGESIDLRYFIREGVEQGEMKAKVRNAEGKNLSSMQSEMPDYQNQFIENNVADDLYAILVQMEIENSSDAVKSFPMYEFTIQQKSVFAVLDPDLYQRLNGASDLVVTLEPGQKTNVVLPFCMYPNQFDNNSDWEELGSSKFQIILSLYPIKNIVELYLS